MMKILLTFSWLCWLLIAAPSAENQGKEAEIKFQIRNAGLAVDGTFSGLVATVQFDPANLSQANIRASVPVSSIKTGISLRDQHLQKPDYFDAEHFPNITLQSRVFRKTGPEQYEGIFMLTMKGISHEVKFPFTVSAAHEFQGKLRVNRLDYGVGKKSLLLADEVNVSIRMKAAGGS
jgi:polyisoprenoid-binding protein YceI